MAPTDITTFLYKHSAFWLVINNYTTAGTHIFTHHLTSYGRWTDIWWSTSENTTPYLNENTTPYLNENTTPYLNENTMYYLNENTTPYLNGYNFLTEIFLLAFQGILKNQRKFYIAGTNITSIRSLFRKLWLFEYRGKRGEEGKFLKIALTTTVIVVHRFKENSYEIKKRMITYIWRGTLQEHVVLPLNLKQCENCQYSNGWQNWEDRPILHDQSLFLFVHHVRTVFSRMTQYFLLNANLQMLQQICHC